MHIFSIDQPANQVLCDTHLCKAQTVTYEAGKRIGGAGWPAVETVLCGLAGSLLVEADGSSYGLQTMAGLQIPAGHAWSATAGERGARVLRVDSPHPGFDPARATMPALRSAHAFAVADGQWLVYDDYVRGGVLNFAPGAAAGKHFHQDADEIFWYFSGAGQITNPDGVTGVDPGHIVYMPAGEWHIIANVSREPLLMLAIVTPNIAPSHTFFGVDGRPEVRSLKPLTHP